MIEYQIRLERGEENVLEFVTDSEPEARDALRDIREEYRVAPGRRVSVYLDEVVTDDE